MQTLTINFGKPKVCVIPIKDGRWRVVKMTTARLKRWQRVWSEWYDRKGVRLAISPEMWVEK